MKHAYLKPLALAAAVLGLQAVSAAAAAQPGMPSRRQVQVLSQGIQRAKSRINSILASRPHRPGGRLEDDNLAARRLTDASDALDKATIEVDAVTAIQDGTSSEPASRAGYHFALGCSKTAIAESRVSRARIAALQPPLGTMKAFGPELQEIATELKALRAPDAAGCP